VHRILCFLCTKELIIYLIDNHLINAVSEAVILSTLSYQEAWEMVISLFLNTCSYYTFQAFTNAEHGDTTVGGKLHDSQQGLFHRKECFFT
jgi:hypothetical protein